MTRQIDLPDDMPKTMRYNLVRDDVGRPVPFFAEWIDGKADFRIMSSKAMRACMMEGLCWVCGRKLTRGTGTFVAGPMCVINQTSAEPPSHFACGEWSAKACPFLAKPGKDRRDGGLEDHELAEPAGVMIRRNPGCTALITSERWQTWRPDPNHGPLWRFVVKQVDWMALGQPATDEQVWESVETGIDSLTSMADAQDADEGGVGSRTALALLVRQQLTLWFPPRPEGVEYPNIDTAMTVP